MQTNPTFVVSHPSSLRNNEQEEVREMEKQRDEGVKLLIVDGNFLDCEIK